MLSLYEEAQYCLKDYSLWSPEAHKELIKRMADRIRELETRKIARRDEKGIYIQEVA